MAALTLESSKLIAQLRDCRIGSEILQPLRAPGAIIVSDEREGYRKLLSQSWRSILLNAKNDLTEAIFLKDKKAFNHWNLILDCIDAEFCGFELEAKIQSVLALPPKRAGAAASLLVSNCRLAVAETHYSNLVAGVGFKRLANMIIAGRVPCGCTGSLVDGKILVL